MSLDFGMKGFLVTKIVSMLQDSTRSKNQILRKEEVKGKKKLKGRGQGTRMGKMEIPLLLSPLLVI